MSVSDQVVGELKLYYLECASVPPFTPRGTALSGSPGIPSVPEQISLAYTVCSLLEG